MDRIANAEIHTYHNEPEVVDIYSGFILKVCLFLQKIEDWKDASLIYRHGSQLAFLDFTAQLNFDVVCLPTSKISGMTRRLIMQICQFPIS